MDAVWRYGSATQCFKARFANARYALKWYHWVWERENHYVRGHISSLYSFPSETLNSLCVIFMVVNLVFSAFLYFAGRLLSYLFRCASIPQRVLLPSILVLCIFWYLCGFQQLLDVIVLLTMGFIGFVNDAY